MRRRSWRGLGRSRSSRRTRRYWRGSSACARKLLATTRCSDAGPRAAGSSGAAERNGRPGARWTRRRARRSRRVSAWAPSRCGASSHRAAWVRCGRPTTRSCGGRWR
ncbi:MAG: hypothetical protein FJ298_09325 [Planctomycetes bacterium]|nr:hypothetical protein [Planctomycetota bacterium]